MCGEGNYLSAMQIVSFFYSGVKKCAATSRKNNVIPGFDQISAHYTNDYDFAQVCVVLVLVKAVNMCSSSSSSSYKLFVCLDLV